MVSANDRMHHAPKSILMAHLRDVGKKAGNDYRKEKGIQKGKLLYEERKPCHIMITINPPTNAQMDAPNWYPTVKALLDGLTDANIFQDDNDKVIKSLTFLPGEKTGSGLYEINLALIDGVPPLLFKQLTIDEILNKENE